MIKSLLVIPIVLATGVSLLAQPSAGKLFVGGNMSFYVETDKTKTGGTTRDNGTSNYMTILPMAGFFLTDKISVGARLGVDARIDKDPGANLEKSTTTTLVFNPFGRYYLISGTGGLFGEASLNIAPGSSKDHYETTTYTAKVLNFSAGVSPGVYYYITEKLSLEAKFGWFGFETEVSRPGEDVKDVHNFFGLSFEPDNFMFGLTYTL